MVARRLLIIVLGYKKYQRPMYGLCRVVGFGVLLGKLAGQWAALSQLWSTSALRGSPLSRRPPGACQEPVRGSSGHSGYAW